MPLLAKVQDGSPVKPRASLEDDLFVGTEQSYTFGLALFSYLNGETLQRLVDEGYAKPDDAQNNSPTLGAFLRLMKDHPAFTANGYAVQAERYDCRVTITGQDLRGKPSPQDLEVFKIISEGADERTIAENRLYCWWD